MIDELDIQPAGLTGGPRLDPMSSPETRARFVQTLKEQIAAGDYEVAIEDIAHAVILDDILFSTPR